MAGYHFLVTCEHGGNRIPPRYRHYFRGHEALLASHRGFDIGALAMARELARALGAPLFSATTSRLLIDLNRTRGHRDLYSEATRAAPAQVRRRILAEHYLPYRRQVEAHIAAAIGRGGRVLHISSHSFTPVLDGQPRNADVGLLYDPARAEERQLCRRWQAQLRRRAPRLKVRRNYPYRGVADGFVTYLRRRFPPAAYVGVELEINQKHAASGRSWTALRRAVGAALQAALDDLDAAA